MFVMKLFLQKKKGSENIVINRKTTYLEVIKEEHTMNAIRLTFAKYPQNKTSSEILDMMLSGDNDGPYPNSDDLVIWEPFEQWTAYQIVNFINTIAISYMDITTNAINFKPDNYDKGNL